MSTGSLVLGTSKYLHGPPPWPDILQSRAGPALSLYPEGSYSKYNIEIQNQRIIEVDVGCLQLTSLHKELQLPFSYVLL